MDKLQDQPEREPISVFGQTDALAGLTDAKGKESCLDEAGDDKTGFIAIKPRNYTLGAPSNGLQKV